jgi:adenosylcobinamide-GDP ribazoletransferase
MILTSLRDALAFLTRIPVGAPGLLTAQRLGRAAAWFPAVGLLVGGVLGGTRILADTILPVGPATLLAITAAILLTGGLHEDGLADAADGFGAHVPRERKLEILRDSRVGTYGALALVLSTQLTWSLLTQLDGVDCLKAALAAHVLARASFLPQALLLKPARDDGSGRLLQPPPVATALAIATAVATALIALGITDGLIALAVAAATSALTILAVRRTLGGSTGDTFGAGGKLVELAVLVAVVAAFT